MIAATISAGKKYIQGMAILLVSCFVFAQDFSFLSDDVETKAFATEIAINKNETVQPRITPSIAIKQDEVFKDDMSDLSVVKNQVTTRNNSNIEVNDTDDILSITFQNNLNANEITAPNASNTINVDEFLSWENNGANLHPNTFSTTVDLSANAASDLTTNVSSTTIQRIWKITELSNNTPTAHIKIPKAAIANTSNSGRYYMFISNTDVFDATSDFRIMQLDANENLITNYNFTGTTYITFGFSQEITEKRSLYFNGSGSYIDMHDQLNLNPDHFTISAWIKRDGSDTGIASILSKRDVAFYEGYDLTLDDTNNVGIHWRNGSVQSLTSYTSIPYDEWHHIAITFNGNRLSIFIDGVLDISISRTAPVPSNQSFHIAAAGKDTTIQHFKGHIDEVRIWNIDLSVDQLRFIMNQEITNEFNQVIGKVIPTEISKHEISSIPWSDLEAYYPMSGFAYKTTIDASGNYNDGALKNLNTVDVQTAPLPYLSEQDGDWNNLTTWSNGQLQSIPGSESIVNPNITVDWNIVRIAHNVAMDNAILPASKNQNRFLLGLFVDSNKLTLNGDTSMVTGNGLTISHYLNLKGTIDLEGESQLIQTLGSDLEVISNGKIERDQQGTADMFTYNYWSSPVTKQNSQANNFKVSDVMKDGTITENPLPVNFSSSGYDGASTHPIKIADYWIWKYANHPTNSNSTWQHIRRTGSIFPGEGFTMKGPGTGPIGTFQNYVFSGKPNNGDVNLSLSENNEYLVGNPYPSAIDANIFIRDNGPELLADNAPNPSSSPLINGTLYFWKHWGGGSHMAQEYKGGYATYNFSGAVAAASIGSDNPDFATGGLLTEKPGRYIPVGQGFFIVGDQGGSVNFNNGQRVFKKEDNSNSEFLRSTNTASSKSSNNTEELDDRMKIRIGFNSVNTIRRQLLLTIDENTTPNVDWAYDGKLNEIQMDDMFWIINDEEYIIQASNDAEVSAKYPIGIKTDADGLNSITIDALENVPNTTTIYLHDILLERYHDLRQSDYEIFLNAGDYLNRFEITFGTSADLLGIEDEIEPIIDILYSIDIDKIILINPNQIEIESIVLFNMLGQSVYTLKDIQESNYSDYELHDVSAGAYTIKLHTVNDSVITKKVIVK